MPLGGAAEEAVAGEQEVDQRREDEGQGRDGAAPDEVEDGAKVLVEAADEEHQPHDGRPEGYQVEVEGWK